MSDDVGKLIEYVAELEREVAALREALTGWIGYGWKLHSDTQGSFKPVYIDDIQEYFDEALKKASP